MKISDAVNLGDVELLARRRLPSLVFDLLAGGSGDEATMRRNVAAFDALLFRPRPFVDVSTRDPAVAVLGDRIEFPVMLSPTGAARVVHREAELAVARAARQAGTLYMQSTVTSYPYSDVAAAAGRPLWFQLYLPQERSALGGLLAQVADAGYSALAVTIDTPTFGNRERDVRNRVTVPVKATPRLLAEALTRPRWAAAMIRGDVHLSRRPGPHQRRQLTRTATQEMILATQYPVTWEDLQRVRALWEGPLLVKGLMRRDEVDQLVDLGVDGIVVSNHGGRQLDGLPSSIEALADVAQANDGRIELYLDGGVRRGIDVLRAVALGARAVFIGRPYLYGLAAAGEAGVVRVLQLLRREIDLGMALLGCRTLADVTPDLVSWRQPIG